jgi:hypothetical protein
MKKKAIKNKSSIIIKSRTPSLARYVSFLVPVALLCLAAGYAHIHIIPTGEDYTGRLAMLDRVFDLFLAAGLVGLAFCVGRRIARWMSLSFATAAEEIAFSVMLGTGTVGLGVLGLGLAGLLRPLPVATLVTLLIGLSGREVATLFRVCKDVVVGATSTKSGLVLTALFTALIAILAIRAATPPHSFDEAIYHLSVTKRFVERGRIYPVLDIWAGNIPFLIHMIYAVCLMAKADIAAKLFSLGLALTTSAALYGFCARFLTRRAGLAAMFGFFGAGMVVEVAVTSRIDVSLAGMLWLTTYAMMIYFETGQSRWLYASAIFAGLSFGVKYPAGVYIVLLGVVFLSESFLKKSEALSTVLKRGVMYAAIVAAVASPWLIKNLVWFHNPVYPLITGEVAEFAPGRLRYFNAADDLKEEAHFDAARRQMPGLVEERSQELAKAASERVDRRPLRFWEYFTKPDLYNMAEDYHYPNYLFLLAPLALFLARPRWLIWLCALSVGVFLLATRTLWVGRMLVPIYPALTLISMYALTEITGRVGRKNPIRLRAFLARAFPIAAIGIAVGSTAFFSIKQIVEANHVDFIIGELSRRSFMRQSFYYPAIDFINHELPKNARVMIIGAQMSYGLQRDYIADANWDSTEWRRLLIRNDSVEEVNQELKRRGVTHVWVDYGRFPFVARMGRKNIPHMSGPAPAAGPDYRMQLRNWAVLDLYSTRFLEPIYTDKFGNIVYRIK